MFFCMAEYCDTLQSKEERNREHKLCLNKGTIVHLLDRFASENGAVLEASVRGSVLSDWLVGLVRNLLIIAGITIAYYM